MTGPDMYAGIYVKDVVNTARVLVKALDASSRFLQPDLVELTVGRDRLILNQYDMKGTPSSNNNISTKNISKELELGVWVNDINEVFESVYGLTINDKNSNINFVSEIEDRSSGLKDFRFRISEGYYFRVTTDSVG